MQVSDQPQDLLEDKSSELWIPLSLLIEYLWEGLWLKTN